MSETREVVEPFLEQCEATDVIEPIEPTLELSRTTKLTSVVRTSIAKEGSVRHVGEYYVAEEPNSFGLPSIETCPGSTPFCEQDCYAIESERRKATEAKLWRNYDALLQADGVEAKSSLIRTMISDYRTSADKLAVEEGKRRFRIHWDGDFFSVEYAESWKQIIEENPDIQFWVYTRSFQEDVNVVPVLAGISNLDLFLSVDPLNVARARDVLVGFENVKVAYLVDYENEAQILIDTLGRNDKNRTMTCPENMINDQGERKLPVIDKKGGACARCTYCIGKQDRKWDVIFVKSGKKYRQQMQLAEMPVRIRPKNETPKKVGAIAAQLTLEVDDLTLF